MSDSRRLTLPEIVRGLGATRATVERLVSQYQERIGIPDRAGIVRTWPAQALEQLRGILAEEQRLREVRQ